MGLLRRKKGNLEGKLGDRLGSIISKNKEVKKLLDERPELYKELEESYKATSKKSQGLRYFAKFIDYVRKPLGFVKLIGGFLGPGPGYLTASLTRLGELGLFTIPYSIYYGLKGGKLKEIGKVVGMELAKIPLPYGDAANFIPVYSHTAKKYVDYGTVDNFLDKASVKRALKGMTEGRLRKVRGLEDVVREQPEELAPVIPLKKKRKLRKVA